MISPLHVEAAAVAAGLAPGLPALERLAEHDPAAAAEASRAVQYRAMAIAVSDRLARARVALWGHYPPVGHEGPPAPIAPDELRWLGPMDRVAPLRAYVGSQAIPCRGAPVRAEWARGFRYRAGRIGACGTGCVAVSTSRGVSWVPVGCGARECPSCEARAADRRRGVYLEAGRVLDRAGYVGRLVTWTQVVEVGEALGDAMARLEAHARAARTSRSGKRRWSMVVAGVRGVEATARSRSRGGTGGVHRWHAHAHAVLWFRDASEAKAWEDGERDAWVAMDPRRAAHPTGGLDVRAVSSDKIGEVVKYAGKVPEMRADMLAEWHIWAAGRKTHRPLGVWAPASRAHRMWRRGRYDGLSSVVIESLDALGCAGDADEDRDEEIGVPSCAPGAAEVFGQVQVRWTAEQGAPHNATTIERDRGWGALRWLWLRSRGEEEVSVGLVSPTGEYDEVTVMPAATLYQRMMEVVLTPGGVAFEVGSRECATISDNEESRAYNAAYSSLITGIRDKIDSLER